MYLPNIDDDNSIGKTVHIPVIPTAVPRGATEMGSASTRGSINANPFNSEDGTGAIKGATLEAPGNNNKIPSSKGSENLPTAAAKVNSNQSGGGDTESCIDRPETGDITDSGASHPEQA